MPMKDLFRRLRPLPLYTVLVLSLAYFLAQSAVSYATHALTLLVGSYHMLCNVLALSGVVFTLKHGQSENPYERPRKTGSESVTGSGDDLTSPEKKAELTTSQSSKHERRLKNTFGWARVDVVVTMMVCVFLASLCFSLLVEAVQTLIHIDHQDPMHHPIPVLCVGGAGLVVNGLCYLLIGGYTFHQGSYLHVTAAGDVILDRVMAEGHPGKPRNRPRKHQAGQAKQNQANVQQTSETKKKEEENQEKHPDVQDKPDQAIIAREHASGYDASVARPRRQGGREMARDVMSSIFVIICSLFVYWTDPDVAKYVDPIISIISCLCLLWLSYPYMKESSLILLQTIPASINIDSLKANLLEAFPDIVNVHELHVWQLTANKIVSTAHIVFQNPEDYGRITDEVADFFREQGITQATIQPEFSQPGVELDGDATKQRLPDSCLMRCPGIEECRDNHCCGDSAPTEIKIGEDPESAPTGAYKRTAAKMQEPTNLVSIKIEKPISSPTLTTTDAVQQDEEEQIKILPEIKLTMVEEEPELENDEKESENETSELPEEISLAHSKSNENISSTSEISKNSLTHSQSLTEVPQKGC